MKQDWFSSSLILQTKCISLHWDACSILMLFYYLDPLQKDCLVTSQCKQFNFGDKREVYLLGESALPVNKKESMQMGKRASALGWNMDRQTFYNPPFHYMSIPNCEGAIDV